jgi:hypothetical protein
MMRLEEEGAKLLRRGLLRREDFDDVERVEAELDKVVAKRAREKADANRTEELWAESARGDLAGSPGGGATDLATVPPQAPATVEVSDVNAHGDKNG